MKLPAIQFYPADWRKDPGVQALDYFDRGVWFEILCLMHESSDRGKLLLNGAAMPDEALARVLGLDNQTLTKTLTTLLRFGVASRDQESGALINRRMVKDEGIRQKRTESGKLGGNPVLLKQKATKGQAERQAKSNQPPKQNPTPSVSTSASTTSSEEKKERHADKPRDPRQDHPAIQAVREAKGSFPVKDTWDLVIKAIGNEPDIERMKQCWLAWRGKGHSPMNLDWLIDWYVNGIPGARNGTHKDRPESGSERSSRNLKENVEYIRHLQSGDSEADSQDPIDVLAPGYGNPRVIGGG